MLKELNRREKEANIKPDADLDVYMKVPEWLSVFLFLFFWEIETISTNLINSREFFHFL